jgi:hypothetical protein
MGAAHEPGTSAANEAGETPDAVAHPAEAETSGEATVTEEGRNSSVPSV